MSVVRGNRGVSALSILVLAAVLGALVTSSVVLATRSATFSSTATLQITPLSGTGDPDRIIATQLAVLGSAAIRGEVVSQVGADDFALAASQRRLSNIVTVRAVSADGALAQQAAAAAVSAYVTRALVVEPVQVTVTPIDPPGRPSRIGSPNRELAVAAVGGAAAGVAVVLVAWALWPRVRPSYMDDGLAAVLLELPYPGGRRRSRDDVARATEVRRLADHLAQAALSRGDQVVVTVTALPGVGRRAAAWVTDALAGAQTSRVDELAASESAAGAGTEATPQADDLADVMIPEPRDGRHAVTFVVARAWVDSERELRKQILSRSAVSDVIVVVLGAQRPALVAPLLNGGASRHGDDRPQRRARHNGDLTAGR